MRYIAAAMETRKRKGVTAAATIKPVPNLLGCLLLSGERSPEYVAVNSGPIGREELNGS